MIRLRKLEPAKLAIKLEKLLNKSCYYEYAFSKLIEEDYNVSIGRNSVEEIFCSDIDLFNKKDDVIESIVEGHIESCEFCSNFEPCPILPSILAA